VSEIKRSHAIPKLNNYGSPRLYKEINNVGVACCKNTVAKLMQKEGIRAKIAPSFKVVTTDSKHNLPIAPSRSGQAFMAHKPNQVLTPEPPFQI
jgi:putative transposase